MEKSSVVDSCIKLKTEIHGVMGGFIQSLRSRELTLMNQVDNLVSLEHYRLLHDDSDDDDSLEGERWKLVGNWKELKDLIETVGSVVRVRTRSESFEVVEQADAGSIVSEKTEENTIEVASEDGEDDEGEEYGDDGSERNNDDMENTEMADGKIEKNVSEIISKTSTETLPFESFSFKFTPKGNKEEEQKSVAPDVLCPYKFSFNDNPQKSSNTDAADAGTNAMAFKFNPQTPSNTYQSSLIREAKSEDGGFQPYKFNLNQRDVFAKKDDFELNRPFVFKFGDDNKSTNIYNRETEDECSKESDQKGFCYVFQDKLKLDEVKSDINQFEPFCFKFEPTSSTECLGANDQGRQCNVQARFEHLQGDCKDVGKLAENRRSWMVV